MLTLVYIRQNLNQAAVGDLFGVSQQTLSIIYRKMLQLIGQALSNIQKAHRALGCPGSAWFNALVTLLMNNAH
ncbi:transposase family protein [Streptomyces violaceusniger]|uniref:transposase family protein n=1 Tax=Streptomyces violaceusniger TaxID=68280 RepID=UPI0037F74E79